LNSKVTRTVGAFDSVDTADNPVPSGLQQDLDYDERSLLFTADQLIGESWSCNARYRISQAVLNTSFPSVPDHLPVEGADSPPARERSEGILQQLTLAAVYNHPKGFFARGEALWYIQDNKHFAVDNPDNDFSSENFWQFNVFLGYRFLGRRAEATVGLLNLSNQDYHLNPLNYYTDLPRERTLLVRLQLSF